MALINIDALAGLNEFNRESLYERLCNAINPLIVTNKKYDGRLEDDLVIVEGNKVATEIVESKMEATQTEIDVLNKLSSQVIEVFTKEFGYPPYIWNSKLSIEENIIAKKKLQRIAQYTKK